jgi:outer membrane biogenesis lipoprotein LolB
MTRPDQRPPRRALPRTVVALLLAATALLSACGGSQSGGASNPDNQFDRQPGATKSP